MSLTVVRWRIWHTGIVAYRFRYPFRDCCDLLDKRIMLMPTWADYCGDIQ